MNPLHSCEFDSGHVADSFQIIQLGISSVLYFHYTNILDRIVPSTSGIQMKSDSWSFEIIQTKGDQCASIHRLNNPLLKFLALGFQINIPILFKGLLLSS